MDKRDNKECGPGQSATEGRDARAAHVAALKEERRGYEVRGMKDRIAQVDEQLAKFGEGPAVSKKVEKRS